MACHTAAIDDLNDEDERQAAARLDEMVDLELSTAKILVSDLAMTTAETTFAARG